MIVLRIEHKVQNFESWKIAFENDPINRKKSGVRGYRVFRPNSDPNYVIIDLEFDEIQQAETVLEALQKLWTQVDGKIIFKPSTRMLEVVETKVY